jgi:hypothetical protein
MGYLKGRFCCLRGLRQQIDDSRDHERALVWVKCCIIIHTLTSIIEEGNKDKDFVAQLVREGTDPVDVSSTRLKDGGGCSDVQIVQELSEILSKPSIDTIFACQYLVLMISHSIPGQFA